MFSLLGPSDLLRRSDQFHAAVDKARLETTEVNISAKKGIIWDDNFDGSYDVQYEINGKLIDATMQLTFKRGFCGWDISGTRNGSTDGPFQLQRGFLAKSGKIFWEERGEFEPRYSILVVGRLLPHVNDGGQREDSAFHGEWLSSQGMKSGRVLKFFREPDDNEAKMPPFAEIV